MHNDDAQQGKRKASQKTELVFWPRLHLPSFTKRIADAGNRVQQLMTMPEMARNTPSEPGNNVRAVMMPSTPFNFGESVVDHGQKSQKKNKTSNGQDTIWSINKLVNCPQHIHHQTGAKLWLPNNVPAPNSSSPATKRFAFRGSWVKDCSKSKATHNVNNVFWSP